MTDKLDIPALLKEARAAYVYPGPADLIERLCSALTTALEIGRAMGIEAAAAIVDKVTEAHKAMESLRRENNQWELCSRHGVAGRESASLATAIRSTAHAVDLEGLTEQCAERVHENYLATCRRLGWLIKANCDRPYAELSNDAKELDRATARAVLARLGLHAREN